MFSICVFWREETFWNARARRQCSAAAAAAAAVCISVDDSFRLSVASARCEVSTTTHDLLVSVSSLVSRLLRLPAQCTTINSLVHRLYTMSHKKFHFVFDYNITPAFLGRFLYL